MQWRQWHGQPEIGVAGHCLPLPYLAIILYNPRMPNVDQLRELTRKFWAGEPIPCPEHPDGILTGNFVQTTYADHIHLACSRGKETIDIPQRPRQQQFNPPQVEGLVVFVQQGDSIRCYRCQSKLVMTEQPSPRDPNETVFSFTCVRCFSWGTWEGRPEEASIEATG